MNKYFNKAMQIFCVAFCVYGFGFSVSYAQDEKIVTKEQADVSNAESTPLTVIELFTAQSCVFCRDADDVLDSLNNVQNVIAISCHVDYYPADSDPLAQSFCTDRQKSYLNAKGIKHIYTPQIVIDGVDFAKAKRVDIERIIQKRMSNEKASIIEYLEIKEGETSSYNFTLPDMSERIFKASDANIYLFGGHAPVEITKSGKPFTMKNAVTQYGELAKWDGTSKDIQFDLADYENLERIIVIVQDKNLNILAAGEKSLVDTGDSLENPFEDIIEPTNSDAKRSEGLPVPNNSSMNE